MNSRLLVILSFVLVAAALYLLPQGTTRRLLGTGRAFTQPARELSAMGQRVAREALGGLPENMTREERDALLAEVARLKEQSVGYSRRLDSLRAENIQLQRLLRHYKQTKDYSMVTAEVVGRSALLGRMDTLVLDRGASDGIQAGQAVLGTEGIVGVVEEAMARQSVVRLVSSPGFSLPASVSGRDATGILENQGGRLVLVGLMGRDFDALSLGDVVVTTELGSEAMQPALAVGTIGDKGRTPDDAPMYMLDASASPQLSSLRFVLVAIRGKY